MRALKPARVVSSDLGRTRQTAALIGHADCPSDARLREWHMGSWTGRTKPELIAAHADLYHAWRAGTHTPEGGEPWPVFRDRVAAGLRHWLAAGEGDLLAVVHGGVIRAALDAFLQMPPARVIPVTPGTGTILSFVPGQFTEAQLEGYNIGAVVPDLSVADYKKGAAACPGARWKLIARGSRNRRRIAKSSGRGLVRDADRDARETGSRALR